MKKAALILFIITSFCISYGQYNNHFLLSTAGDEFTTTEYVMSWSLGEVITETFSNGELILTQGFQQSKMRGVGIYDNKGNSRDVFDIYPNPNYGEFDINLKGDKTVQTDYIIQIYDIRGEIIDSREVNRFPIKIEMIKNPSGLYLLRIINTTNKMSEVISIQKLGS